ncbi:MFS transporter [Heyndrickxia oleronia]|uniref:MFS transporter n=1 Tax=Heyndrickxia oleronia TaxID=38875 RepID=A0A8E2I7N2_9BACI|nr:MULTISPECIES: MFS transporter [Bacillaceae]OJH18412.1 MFS transporter [Bacillus obstructivus]MCM3453939.1 MFS transporter [Heyndrickxia oleronia]MDH5164106.1 MFS transporter [Heyndrickxia oleronia]MEC1374550.1 MFS transporter [Heyndrickxia oleronia]OOP68241.1 MFS transporter [Heyndrickxia oleronia]
MSSTLKIYTLAVLSFLVGTSEYIIAGILDKIAESTGVTLVTAGQLITIFSLSYAFGTPIVMALTARMERRKLLLYALTLFVISNVLAYMLTGYELLIASRILMGISAGVTVVASLTIATKVALPGKEGSAIAAVLMGFTASLILGVPIGRVISSAYEWKAIFGGIGLVGLLALFIIAITIPRMAAEAPVPLRSQLALLKQPKMLIGLSVSFFWIVGYSIFYSYISPFLLTVTGMSDKTLSITLFAVGIASLIGSKFGGFGTDKWGIHRTLIGGLSLNVAALLLIMLFAQSPVILISVLVIWSCSTWSPGPPQQLHLIRLAPESSGIMLSLNNSTIQLAMAAGAGIGGAAVEQISLSSVTWVAAVGTAFAVGAVFLSRRYDRSTSSQALGGQSIINS